MSIFISIHVTCFMIITVDHKQDSDMFLILKNIKEWQIYGL